MNYFVIGAAVLIVVYMVSVVYLSGHVFESFARRSEFDPIDLKKIYYTLDKNGKRAMAAKISKCIDWFKKTEHEDVSITAEDGVKLHARLYTNKDGDKKTAILAHGYKSLPELDFSVSGKALYEMGYDILLIDERAHGESGGDYITFGAKESRDLVGWCNWVKERSGNGFVIFGISEGCTSAILASCMRDMPDGLECVIADCGYTDINVLFRNVFGKLPVPKFLLMPILNSLCKKRGGFKTKEFDTVSVLSAGARVPYLFIHGDNDDFVPVMCTEKNFEACGSEKKLVVIQGAGHGKSFIYDEERYMSEIGNFLKQHSLTE